MYDEQPEGKDFGLARCQQCKSHGVDPETNICTFCNHHNEEQQ